MLQTYSCRIKRHSFLLDCTNIFEHDLSWPIEVWTLLFIYCLYPGGSQGRERLDRIEMCPPEHRQGAREQAKNVGKLQKANTMNIQDIYKNIQERCRKSYIGLRYSYMLPMFDFYGFPTCVFIFYHYFPATCLCSEGTSQTCLKDLNCTLYYLTEQNCKIYSASLPISWCNATNPPSRRSSGRGPNRENRQGKDFGGGVKAICRVFLEILPLLKIL